MTALPPLPHELAKADILISSAVPAPESRRAYIRAIREFVVWFSNNRHTAFTKAVAQEYRAELLTRQLAPSTINQKLSAIRRLALELNDNGLLDPAVASAISRTGGIRQRGCRIGNWLDHNQAQMLLYAPCNSTLRGKRDRSILAVLLCCGLRRNELVGLTVNSVQLRCTRWMFIDIRGKHGRVRSVPMTQWCKAILDEWLTAAGITDGRIFRPVDKSDHIHGDRLSAQAVYEIVRDYGTRLSIAVTPHDLRRSFARLAHSGNAELEQIQLTLGHSSLATTETYIGVQQRLDDAPCDRLNIAHLGS